MILPIAVLAGDGIGPEVMSEALRVLESVGKCFGHTFEFEHGLVGGAAYERYQNHFPDETRDICVRNGAVLFGSVGGPVAAADLPKWKDCERNSILAIRKAFQFNANFRPVRVFPGMQTISPLKQEIVGRGVDLLFVRELLGDIYFGEHRTETMDGSRVATDVAVYTEEQIASVAHIAFKAAMVRRKRVTSVDKANVLDTSKLWRTVVREVAKDYPEVELNDMLVDNCAMQLIANPSQFDVVLTANLFGDILSDAGAVLPGSLGLLPSASFNESGFGLYEPSGGSAPDIAGTGTANPVAQILSAALMLRYSFNLHAEAVSIENAAEQAVRDGYRTKDIAEDGRRAVGTSEIADAIIERIGR